MAQIKLANNEIDRNLTQQAKMASLGECVAHLSHELNNPLAIINSKVEDLLRRLHNGTLETPKLEQDLRKVLETTARINKISKTFLNFSRQTADSDPLTPFSIRTAVEDSLQICGHRLSTHQVELKLNISNDLMAQGRPWEISQILVNLIQNASDAISELPERWIEIKTYRESNSIFVTVTDSGQGIPFPVREQMMKPFFTTKKAGLGSGIGLSLSQRLALNNGAKLSYNDSSPRTQFVLELSLGS